MAVTVRGPFTAPPESLTVAGTAVNFASPIVGATAAFVTVENAAIRFWMDGTTPTALLGHVAEAGDVINLHSPEEVRLFEAIRRDGVSAVLRISYSRKGIN